MLRLGLLAGLILGLTELFLTVGLDGWRGLSTGLLGVLALSAALGGVAGLGWSLLSRIVLPNRSQGTASQIVGGVTLLLAGLALGVIIHGSYGIVAKLGLLAAPVVWAALSLGILRGGPDETPAKALPRFAGILVVVAALALLGWSWRQQHAMEPVAALSVVVPEGADPLPTEPLPAPKVMMIGIDGATWDVILPMIDEGRLPHLERLIDRGVAGILRSDLSSFSPIVWTTITTGKTPDHHGLDQHSRVWSTNREVRTVWSMLGDAGYKSLVANVPGTYPAEPIPGVMFAGFPVIKESVNNLGHIYSTDAEESWILPTGNIKMKLERFDELSESAPGARTGQIVQREPSSKKIRTVVGELSRRLRGKRPYDQLDTTYSRIAFTERDDQIELKIGGQSLSLGAGEWSPWIKMARPFMPLVFKLRVLELGDDLSIYVTPLFRLDSAQRTHPAELADEVDRRFGPYVIEGSGWVLFQSPRLLRTLSEHQHQIAQSRLDVINDVWQRGAWDAMFYVLTLTDRIQHPFWNLIDHEHYPNISKPPPYPHALTAEQRAEHASEVARSYEWSDRALGELLTRADDDTLIVVVSDHGATSGVHKITEGGGIHHPDGIYIIAGGPFDRAEVGDGTLEISDHPDPRINGERLKIVDVTPTLLAALGLPIAQDFDGGPSSIALAHARADGDELAMIPSYDQGVKQDKVSDELDEGALEMLRSLGYVK